VKATKESKRLAFLVRKALAWIEDSKLLDSNFLREYNVTADECYSLHTAISAAIYLFLLIGRWEEEDDQRGA